MFVGGPDAKKALRIFDLHKAGLEKKSFSSEN